jgi:hypothetical protein
MTVALNLTAPEEITAGAELRPILELLLSNYDPYVVCSVLRDILNEDKYYRPRAMLKSYLKGWDATDPNKR